MANTVLLAAGKSLRPALRPHKVPMAGRMLNATGRLMEVFHGARDKMLDTKGKDQYKSVGIGILEPDTSHVND